ncbi:FGGY-family carbohydrate kinase [Leifsonia sp. F6_8S_P_1B]|uniref:FGGY-family carbohydrate kinase n=1 Tax=Leifsonia williamsii TaxID=3035919 RepID=A0ABT8KDG7_9MICO|nr:FGGY-family carbohydrate kinase [Leifsonia williamsii]MDN4615506.1 FGGY-family carbohydrate kinase [Leifsonia williamsii]
MTSYVVAIDNGSQSTKVLVVDERGVVHASARVGLLPYRHPGPGRAVHPDDDVWTSIAAACRIALDRFEGDPSRIVGVGLCTIRFCRALLTESGDLAEPLLSWMDERVGRPYRHDDPRVARVTTSSGYIAHRLTGRFVDTAANYQGVWPIDQTTWRWSDDPSAYQATGMPRELLFDLVDPGDRLGTVTEAAAAATGLPPGVPVFATANDKAVEALGAGLARPDQLLLSLGTYISSMTVAAAPGGGAAHWVNFGSRPGQYLAESGGIRRGMWTVSWFRSLLQGAGPRDDAMYDLEAELDREAALLPPGSDGVRAVLDWLAPADHPGRRGALLGFSGAQGRAHVYRAILEGIAFEMADNADAMAAELGSAFTEVLVTGGGARSRVLPQLVADVTGRPVRRAALDDAAGLGAAVCAAVGSGMHAGWDVALDAMVRLTDPVLPSSDAGEYARLRPLHRRAREGVRALSEELSDSAVD